MSFVAHCWRLESVNKTGAAGVSAGQFELGAQSLLCTQSQLRVAVAHDGEQKEHGKQQSLGTEVVG